MPVHSSDSDGDVEPNIADRYRNGSNQGDISSPPSSTQAYSPTKPNQLEKLRGRENSAISPRGSTIHGSRGLSPRHASVRVTDRSIDRGEDASRKASLQEWLVSTQGASYTTDDEGDLRHRLSRAPIVQRSQGMTAETETVPSVPTLAVGAGAGNGSLRVKRSTDNVVRQARQKRRGARLAAASKADIFAAKVASAVDEADSSNSDETFVYDTNPSAEQLRRPYLRTTSTLSLPVDDNGPVTRRGSIANMHAINSSQTLSGSRAPVGPSNASISGNNAGTPTPAPSNPNQVTSSSPNSPPVGRDFVVSRDPRNSQWAQFGANKPTDSMRAKHDYLQRWRTAGSIEDEDEDLREEFPHSLNEYTPLRGTHSASLRYPTRQYLSNPHDYGASTRPPGYVRAALWAIVVLTCMLAVSLVAGLLLASSRPLQSVHIARLNDVVSSDKELVFSVIVRARNPGYVTVPISNVDLDVFATSNFVNHLGAIPPHEEQLAKPRTVLLGNVEELESPLIFSGGFVSPKNEWSMAVVRLKSPGGNDTVLWQNISGNPFELTVRGVLKYDLLFGSEVKAIVSASAFVSEPLPVPDDQASKLHAALHPSAF